MVSIHKIVFFFICDFLISKFEKKHQILCFIHFLGIVTVDCNFNCLLIEGTLDPLKLYKIMFFYHCLMSEICRYEGSTNDQNLVKSWKKKEFQIVSPDIVPFKSLLVSICSPWRAHLNGLCGFFHTQFIEEILAKYRENPAVSAAAKLTIVKPTALQHWDKNRR